MRDEALWPWFAACVCLSFLALLAWAALRPWSNAPPEILGGTSIQDVLSCIGVLHETQRTPGLYTSGDVSLLIQGLETQWTAPRCPYKFDFEFFDVDIDGYYQDSVAIAWLRRPDEVAADAPVLIIVPGLCCDETNLPGTSLYPFLLQRNCRVGVFLKRGVASRLSAPVFHLFGHPSDLQAVLATMAKRRPHAAIHILSFSSGNGLAGSYATIHGGFDSPVKSYLCMFGGSDYNALCGNSRRGRMCSSWLTVDVVLMKAAKAYFLQANEQVLCNHSVEGYRAAMRSRNFQELQNTVTLHFSGYSSAGAADRRTNGFAGGPARFKGSRVPILWVTCADDPMLPGGPNDTWRSAFGPDSPNVALAVFRRGSHGAAYESLRLAHWSDRLVSQWLDAMFSRGAARIPASVPSAGAEKERDAEMKTDMERERRSGREEEEKEKHEHETVDALRSAAVPGIVVEALPFPSMVSHLSSHDTRGLDGDQDGEATLDGAPSCSVAFDKLECPQPGREQF